MYAGRRNSYRRASSLFYGAGGTAVWSWPRRWGLPEVWGDTGSDPVCSGDTLPPASASPTPSPLLSNSPFSFFLLSLTSTATTVLLNAQYVTSVLSIRPPLLRVWVGQNVYRLANVFNLYSPFVKMIFTDFLTHSLTVSRKKSYISYLYFSLLHVILTSLLCGSCTLVLYHPVALVPFPF